MIEPTPKTDAAAAEPDISPSDVETAGENSKNPIQRFVDEMQCAFLNVSSCFLMSLRIFHKHHIYGFFSVCPR